MSAHSRRGLKEDGVKKNILGLCQNVARKFNKDSISKRGDILENWFDRLCVHFWRCDRADYPHLTKGLNLHLKCKKEKRRNVVDDTDELFGRNAWCAHSKSIKDARARGAAFRPPGFPPPRGSRAPSEANHLHNRLSWMWQRHPPSSSILCRTPLYRHDAQ